VAVPHATDDYATGTGWLQVGATLQISPDEEKRATVLEGEICLFASLRTANKRGSNKPEATSKESVHKFVHALFCIRPP
jgi:hypothetical protein